jgi:hypothetical protein
MQSRVQLFGVLWLDGLLCTAIKAAMACCQRTRIGLPANLHSHTSSSSSTMSLHNLLLILASTKVANLQIAHWFGLCMVPDHPVDV